MSSNKSDRFRSLSAEARGCEVCDTMKSRTAVMSRLNGSLDPRVLFIAEAPGRMGADRTRRPFFGDKSGEYFDVFLDAADLDRSEIFITNSVLCSPRKPSGANRRPSVLEVRNCSGFLKRTIDLINPTIIATLGVVALEALKSIEDHDLTIKLDVGKVRAWNGRLLVPLYHPSPQVIASHRNVEQQKRDYTVLRTHLKRQA